jgi:hypothetical protein
MARDLGYPSNSSPIRSRQTQAPSVSSRWGNPIQEVCKLWQELLFETEEFKGYFANCVFSVGGEMAGQEEFREIFG